MSEGESKIIDGLTDERRKSIDSHFSADGKISADVLNTWGAALLWIDGGMFDELTEIPNYEKSFPKNSTEEVAYIMKKSDPQTIIEYNTLVKKYNDDLPRIKKEKDAVVVINFVAKAEKIVRGTDKIG